jgi:hypothetical protein
VVVEGRHPKKSIHVKGWCGPGRVQSPSDFDRLDAPRSWFLRQQDTPVSNEHTRKQKKNTINEKHSMIQKTKINREIDRSSENI